MGSLTLTLAPHKKAKTWNSEYFTLKKKVEKNEK
jgi:hypothetical protein